MPKFRFGHAAGVVKQRNETLFKDVFPVECPNAGNFPDSIFSGCSVSRIFNLTLISLYESGRNRLAG